jgi:putative membrane protein
MKKYIRFSSAAAMIAIAAAGIFFIVTAQAADEMKKDAKMESKLSANDKKFVKKAYKGGLTEVAEAQTAKEKAKNDATKDVAERMITDHGKANEKLMEIAREENLDLGGVEAKPADFSGDNFDKEYLMALKKDHEKDIAMFEKEANDTGTNEDSDVKKFAKDTLPTLKEHLQMVEDALAKAK